mgnify:CR=1 FL=1
MKRHRRSFHEFGDAHEVTFSCYRRFPFFRAERTCEWLKQAIDSARVSESFALWAYVFMPDHIHLLILPVSGDADMARILKSIKSPVGRRALRYVRTHSPEWLPRLSRTRGQKREYLFWQSGGGYDRNVTNPDTLLSMIDYIHANPVRKGYVERPRDWRWSSAAWYDDHTRVPINVDPIPNDWLE